MSNRLVVYAFVYLTIASLTAQAQMGQLKPCHLTSKSLVLKKGPRPLRLSGALLKEGKHEYRLTVKSDLKVQVRLITKSQLSLDIYSFKPPKKLMSKTLEWSDILKPDNEYALVVSNCYGTTNGSYQIEITAAN
jgi:hypothetical protein